MNFHRGRFREEPEINLIPMIDVLLVILIFLMINADAKAAHQSVIDVMQAAQQAGLAHISFATQAPSN